MKLTGSGYEIFGQRQFRHLWIANLASNLCLVMLMLGVAWTMTSLTTNPVLVSMVQTVMGLPFILFSIPVGMATDAVGHRTMLVASQFWMLAVILLMGCIAWYDGWHFTPLLLLSSTFLVGFGVVIQQSAWKPFLHDAVGKDKLISAIALNSLSSDIGRAVGPAVGGYLMGFFGTAVVLFTSAISQLIMIVTLQTSSACAGTRSDCGADRGGADRGDADRGDADAPARSIKKGWSYLRQSPHVYGPLLRCGLLMAPCGGVLGLLPLVAQENVQAGPIGYGGMLVALGIGTATGGALMPVLRRHFGFGVRSAAPLGVFSLAIVGISQWDSMQLDVTFLFFLGFSWSLLSIAHQFAVQIASPENMRGLMNSLYALVLQGSMAAGSVGFGLVAQSVGVSRSVLLAGFIAASGLLLVRRYPMPDQPPPGIAT